MKFSTRIQVTSEAGVIIIFKIASSVKAVRNNMMTILKKKATTSSTAMAYLLAVTPTEPVQNVSDALLPYVHIDFRNKEIDCNGEILPFES